MTRVDDVVVPEAELDRRTIVHTSYVSCPQAFIDCRTPGSESKENYSIIGSGVTQNAAQVVNLREPHGFNVGAAAMPHGVVNNLHLHFTAEVFYNFRGHWTMRWGVDGADGEYLCRPGDVLSVPTWVFRGFTNSGADDGWLFTVLGFDDTGGIVWAPSVIAEARAHGLVLNAANEVVDISNSQVDLAEIDAMPVIGEEDIAALRTWTTEQMQARLVAPDDLAWSRQAFLCSVLPGGGAEFASVIGYGMSEDRDQVPPIHYPHNFSLAWLRARSADGLLTHRHGAPQAVIVDSGRWRVFVNRGANEISREVGPGDTMSIPPGAWRRFEVVSAEPGLLLVINGGDARVRLEWDEGVRADAAAKGRVRDAAGYVAPLSVARVSTLDD